MARIAGIDVGGTFTDLILIDENRGAVEIAKVPTTVENQAFGVIAALDSVRVNLGELAAIVHGTTTTTNALLERKVARVGLITTKGFRDILELGRRTRPKPYGLMGGFKPLISREFRLEVVERIDAEGGIIHPLDEEGVTTAARELLAKGAEAIVIHFLHSYANPIHERRAKEIVRAFWPNGYVTAGHEIVSEYREYERGVTASVNASVQPILHRYIERLQTELRAKGFNRDLLVMQGNGGTVAAGIVTETAVNTVMSGPASGVIAAAYTAKAAGFPNVITYDMGGTSSDVGLIQNGMPQVSSELEIEYAMPVHVPMVDVHTIGAGGGSLAYVNEAGMLQVGPESAGARPGPICYGRGGSRPTITDANFVLGRLNPEKLLAVDNPVSMAQVCEFVEQEVGKPLGLNAVAAAAAILRIANDRMAGAIRMVSLSRGHDPRDFALFAFGGAGPLHAVALAKELAIPKVLIPARPGITNALGCTVADLRHDYVRTINRALVDLPETLVTQILAEQIKEGRATIDREAIAVETIEILHTADMQFQGQSHILTVPLKSSSVTCAELQAAFAAVYWTRFEVELKEIRPVLVNLHTAVIGKRSSIPLKALISLERKDSLQQAQIATRKIWFEGEWQDTPIYRREFLPEASVFSGPAIVEQFDTTIVIEPGSKVESDSIGNLIVSV